MGLLSQFPGKDHVRQAGDAGTCRPGVDYALRFDPDMDLFLVQYHDSTGRHLCDDGRPAVARFALRENEFALKYANRKQLSQLLGQILTFLPGDRLIDAYYVDSNGQPAGRLVPKSNCESIDDGAYRRERSERLSSFIGAQDTLYVIYTRLTGPSIPFLDYAGRAWVFTREAYARKVQQDNPDCLLEVRACDQAQFHAFVRGWYALGVTHFVLNIGTNDHRDALARDLCFPVPEGERADWAATELNRWTLNFVQNRYLDEKADNAGSLVLSWAMLCSLIPDELYLVPVEAAFESDAVHLSRGALALFQARADAMIREGLASPEDVCDAVLARYPGSASYHIASASETPAGHGLHLRVVMEPGGEQYFCAFTSFDALCAIFGEDAHVALFSWDDIVSMLDTRLSNSDKPAEGIVINPGWINLLLHRDDLEKLREGAK